MKQPNHRSNSNRELDLTPMVDVVFLLLIFFMVTASFTLQNSLAEPQSRSSVPSPTDPDDVPDPDAFVEVHVAATNTYYVTVREAEEVEAPSEREMRDRIRDARWTTGARRLVIRADVDSRHRNVVAVLDAGNAAGFEQIEMRTTDEDY